MEHGGITPNESDWILFRERRKEWIDRYYTRLLTECAGDLGVSLRSDGGSERDVSGTGPISEIVNHS